MPEKTANKIEQDVKIFEETYNKVAKDSSVVLKTCEWANEKESFEIFSVYSDKTPVISSSSTIIVQL